MNDNNYRNKTIKKKKTMIVMQDRKVYTFVFSFFVFFTNIFQV